MKAFRATSVNQFRQALNLPAGEYTLSFWWWSRSYTSFSVTFKHDDNTTTVLWTDPGASSTYYYFEKTFLATKRITEISFPNPAGASSQVIIVAPMLEHGNNASTGVPHKDDVSEEIENVDGKYGEQIIELGNRITTTNQQHEQLYWKKTEGKGYVDGKETIIRNDYNTKFSQTADQIALKASQVSVDSLGNRVTSAESSITQQATQIALKASQVSVDSLGNRVTSAESSITQQATQIALKVSQDEMQSAITQSANTINLRVDNIEDGLEATGIDIELNKITVTAPKFLVKKPDGTPLAVFDDNINIDNYGNMTLKSLRTPPIIKSLPFNSTTKVYTLDVKREPNVIVNGISQAGYIDLPNTQDCNGLHISVGFDNYIVYGGDSIFMTYLRTPSGNNIYTQDTGFVNKLPLPSFGRVYYDLVGIWSGSKVIWVVKNMVSFVKPTIVRAGGVIARGKVNQTSAYNVTSPFGSGCFTVGNISTGKIELSLNPLTKYEDISAVTTLSSYTLQDMYYLNFYEAIYKYEIGSSGGKYIVEKKSGSTNVNFNGDIFVVIAAQDFDLRILI